MRLTFFGSSLVSSYWNGAATYYRGLIRALAELGHEVTFCEPDAYGRQQRRDLVADPEYARVIVYSAESERDALVADALQTSDWVIKCSGVGVWDGELEAAVAAGCGGASTAFLDVDAPATLGRIAAELGDPFRRLIPRYDQIFAYGGGPPVIAAYVRWGARSCVPIYNGLDPNEHRPPEQTSPKRYDLLFMGNRLPDREVRVDEFFLKAAALCPDRVFALGGEGWGDKPLPANVEYLGHVPTNRHNEVNAAARMVLNIHRESMVENGWSPATRMFEAAGAAACQITDWWPGIDEFFEPDAEILVARDGVEVADLIRATDDAAAAEIGAAARRRALRGHTYASRAALMDAILRKPARSVA